MYRQQLKLNNLIGGIRVRGRWMSYKTFYSRGKQFSGVVANSHG